LREYLFGEKCEFNRADFIISQHQFLAPHNCDHLALLRTSARLQTAAQLTTVAARFIFATKRHIPREGASRPARRDCLRPAGSPKWSRQFRRAGRPTREVKPNERQIRSGAGHIRFPGCPLAVAQLAPGGEPVWLLASPGWRASRSLRLPSSAGWASARRWNKFAYFCRRPRSPSASLGPLDAPMRRANERQRCAQKSIWAPNWPNAAVSSPGWQCPAASGPSAEGLLHGWKNGCGECSKISRPTGVPPRACRCSSVALDPGRSWSRGHSRAVERECSWPHTLSPAARPTRYRAAKVHELPPKLGCPAPILAIILRLSRPEDKLAAHKLHKLQTAS